MRQTIIPNLWFDGQAQEAAEFYTSVFPDSRLIGTTPYPEGGVGEPGTVMTVEFVLEGQRFLGINGGPQFPFTEAVSFEVVCRDQGEIDHYWTRLSEDGERGQCGWLKDRFGLSWQVVPEGMGEVLSQDHPERARRAMAALMEMTKIDLAALRRATSAVPAG